MSKPDDIPQDVWEVARICICGFMAMNSSSFSAVCRCARAIIAERDRCESAVEAIIRDRHTRDRNPLNVLADVLEAIRHPSPGA